MQAQVGVRRWQDTPSLVLGVVPRLPRREAGDWLPALFGPQAECVGGEGKQGIWGVDTHFPLPGPVGREGPLGLEAPRPIQTCPVPHPTPSRPPFCWLRDTHQVQGAGWGQGGLAGCSDGGLESWGSDQTTTAKSQPLASPLHHSLAQTMQERVPGDRPRHHLSLGLSFPSFTVSGAGLGGPRGASPGLLSHHELGGGGGGPLKGISAGSPWT